jgi:predicted DNA-binding transcriptional regulator YafY
MNKNSVVTLQREALTKLEWIKLIQAATTEEIVTFEYRKATNEGFVRRVVRLEDAAISSVKHDEYVTGWDYDRQDYRSFRLSRMKPGSLKVAA